MGHFNELGRTQVHADRWLVLLALVAALLATAFAGARASEQLPLEQETEQGGPASPETSDPRQLLECLADENYLIRRAATERLAELKGDAFGVLRAGLAHSSSEVRRTCRMLLREGELARFAERLEAFRQGAEQTADARDSELPGWGWFRELVGESLADREFFAAMVEAERDLFLSLHGEPEAVTATCDARIEQLTAALSLKSRNNLSVHSIAGLLLVFSRRDLPLSDSVLDSPVWNSVLRQPAFVTAWQDDEQKKYLKPILSAWMAQKTGLSQLRYKLQIAVQRELPAGLPLAVAVLRAKIRGNPVIDYLRAEAIAAVGHLGGKPHIATLAEYLEDDTTVGRRIANVAGQRQVMTIEVRDVALAWLVHLTEQQHADYLQPSAERYFQRRTNRSASLSAAYLGFQSNEDREKALARWKQWVGEHPLPETPRLPDDTAQLLVLESTSGAGVPSGDHTAGGIPLAEHRQVENLRRAEQLISEQRFFPAVQLLGGLLLETQDTTYRPSLESSVFLGLRSEVEQLLGKLPEEGRAAFELTFGGDAEAAYQQALEGTDAQALEQIAQRFFFTRAGSEAAWLAAVGSADRGALSRAAFLLQRLKSLSWHADRFEPHLSWKLASCWAALGYPDAARATLEQLRTDFPEASLKLGGQTVKISSEEDLLPPSSPTVLPIADLWSGWGGRLDGNPRVEDPIAPSAQSISLGVHSVGQHATELARHLPSPRTYFPSSSPAVAQGRAVFRLADRVQAVELATGQLSWERPCLGAFSDLLRRGDPETEADRQIFVDAVGERLFANPAFGSLSTDGHRVYYLECMKLGVARAHQELTVFPNGDLALDASRLGTHNLLSAVDLKTGRLAWELGGPESERGLPLAGHRFLSPPVAIGDRLYVVTVHQNHSWLQELAATDGRPLWTLRLQSWEVANKGRQTLAERLDERQFARPVVCDGILICAGAENCFVAIDLATRNVRWVFRREADHDRRSAAGPAVILANGIRQATVTAPHPAWEVPALMGADGHVVIAPPAGNKLYCLDLHEGTMAWSTEVPQGRFVAGCKKGLVLAATRQEVRAYALATGEMAWPRPLTLPQGCQPVGTGYFDAANYYLPLEPDGVLALEIETGAVQSLARLDEQTAPGNLIPVGEGVLLVGADIVQRLQTMQQYMADLEAEFREHPESDSLRRELAEARLAAGQLSAALELLDSTQNPDEKIQHLLGQVLLDGLRTAPNNYLDRASQFDWSDLTPPERREFLTVLAHAQFTAMRHVDAFRTWLKVASLPDNDGTSVQFVGADHIVSSRQLTKVAVNRVYEVASPADRERMRDLAAQSDDPIWSELLDGLRTSSNEAALSELQRVERAMASENWLEAEQRLRTLLLQTDGTAQTRAMARLVDLYLLAERPAAAAAYLRYLLESAPEEPLWNSQQTPREFQATVEDQVLRQYLNGTTWTGTCTVRETGQQASQLPYFTYAGCATQELVRSPLYVSVQMQGRGIRVRDYWGRQLFELEGGSSYRPLPSTQLNGPRRAQFAQAGHLLVIEFANVLAAVDALAKSPRVIWQRNIRGDGRQGQMLVLRAQVGAAPAWDRAALLPPALAGAHAVCLLHGNTLEAVDPLSGDTLWQRMNVPANSRLYGDDSCVILHEEGQRGFIVYDSRDGTELQRGDLPSAEAPVAVSGSLVVQLLEDGQQRKIVAFEPRENRVRWSHELALEAVVTRHSHGLTVLDPAGALTCWDLDSGEPKLRARLPIAAKPQGVLIRDSLEHCLVYVNTDPIATSIQTGYLLAGMIPINGSVYCLDRDSGEVLWHRDTPQECVSADEPPGLPALMLIQGAQEPSLQYTQTFVDVRNGSVLHQASGAGMMTAATMEAQVYERRVILHSPRGSLQFSFSSMPE